MTELGLFIFGQVMFCCGLAVGSCVYHLWGIRQATKLKLKQIELEEKAMEEADKIGKALKDLFTHKPEKKEELIN